MGTVEFSEHLGKQFCEVVVIVDIRQEFDVVLSVVVPVGSVEVFYIEFLFYLLPDMVEDIFALCLWLVFEFSGEEDRLLASAVDIDFSDLASGIYI